MKRSAISKLLVNTAILRGATILGVFAITGVGLVAYTFNTTEAVIAESERQALLAQFHELLPGENYNNDLLEDVIQISDIAIMGTGKPFTAYRAYQDDVPVALFATPVAIGYGGSIKLLVAVRADGSLIGVRALSSRETPGLGDGIDTSRSDWMLGFDSRSLGNPQLEDWRLKKFGGEFDQLTGATVTSGAVVNEVRKFLMYFERNKKRLFSLKNTTTAIYCCRNHPDKSVPGYRTDIRKHHDRFGHHHYCHHRQAV